MKEKIAHLLMDALKAEYIKIVDDSEKHKGHKGTQQVGNTHFTVTIISAFFKDKSLVSRHRMIYNILDPCIKQGVHAIGINAKAPSE